MFIKLFYNKLLVAMLAASIFCIMQQAKAQEHLRNINWCLGYSPPLIANFANGVNFGLFTLGGPSLSYGASNISDTLGNLQFFCNGFYLYDTTGYNMGWFTNNWDSLNCPLGFKFRNKYNGDGFFNQMSIILPKKNNEYYVFTTGMSDFAFDQWQSPNANFDSFRFDVLTYHLVNMDSNAGKGKVISKNNILLQDTPLSHNTMQAVRHGNGKDWWLMKPLKEQHTFATFLVNEDGITGPWFQSFNYPKLTPSIHGHSKFSEDGRYFCFLNENYAGEAHLYHFDRCSGKLSNYKKIIIPLDSSVLKDDWASGVSFSPNNKLMYINTNYHVYQIDLQDTLPNYLLVGAYVFNYPKWDVSALAPNGKIYIANQNGTHKSMSYIDSPDVKGLGCNFVAMGLTQPYTNFKSLPNLPNYGLGKIANQGIGYDGCWPVQITPEPATEDVVRIYPNPSDGLFTLEYQLPIGQLGLVVVYDLLGKPLLNKTLSANNTTTIIDLQGKVQGVYSCKVSINNKIYVYKVVLQ
jgi:hypothetical protein